MTKNKNVFLSIIVITVIILISIWYFGVGKTTNNKEALGQNTVSDSLSDLTYFKSKEEAISALNNIKISSADDSEYNGDIRNNEWGGWKDISGWNTREEVLLKDAINETHNNKNFESGVWYSQYNGEDIICNQKEDVSKNIQIDHIIPIAYVHRHGGSSWDLDKKQEYYNDYGSATNWTVGVNKTNDYEKCGVLIAVDSKSNIQKSDKGPSEWMPSNKDYCLEYCERWIIIANNWDISIDQADYDVISSYINSV